MELSPQEESSLTRLRHKIHPGARSWRNARLLNSLSDVTGVVDVVDDDDDESQV